ncbi:transglutaminase domain-containing protein [Brachybacterium fresconis]|uniref:Transglutaminase-like domain-containing protein n=1 Tax=Brachybacterium fresconis TaxID=173363 RepID=A0ABS4YL24_9MICO|nr:transglutaminase domain-containing protein [Brachybacterium fresconis]MBP2409509.1 hypothetical protein [Brachybacterium fresconis]
MIDESDLVEIFERVRSLPYDTLAAHDAAGLLVDGRGNCVATAGLLSEELSALGARCRAVSWEYELPVLVDAQQHLAFRSDIHTTVQVRVEGRWVLADATHDPRLGILGLTIGRWDGHHDTEPAYRAVGPCVVHGQDGPGSTQLKGAMERIGRQVEATDPDLIAQYQRDLNELFEGCRSTIDGRATKPYPAERPDPRPSGALTR